MAKILMIDDDPDWAAGMRILMEARGHQFFHADGGEAGLAKVKVVAPDLILLDVMMETRTEGFHVSLKLRDRSLESEYAAYRDVPIIVVTSLHQSTDLRFSPDADFLPVDAMLEKSTRLDVILAEVDTLLARRRAQQN